MRTGARPPLCCKYGPVLCPLCLLTPSQAHIERVTASCCSAHPASAQVWAAARAVARHHREGLQPVPMLPSSSSRCVTGLEVAGLVAGPCRAVIAVQQGRLQETQLCVETLLRGCCPSSHSLCVARHTWLQHPACLSAAVRTSAVLPPPCCAGLDQLHSRSCVRSALQLPQPCSSHAQSLCRWCHQQTRPDLLNMVMELWDPACSSAEHPARSIPTG